MRPLIAMSLLVAVSAAANPFAAIPTYMASEHLSVDIAKSEARLTGDFVFRRSVVVLSEQDSRVVFQIPIWFPDQNAEDKTVAEFWATFQRDTSYVIPTEKVTWMRPKVAADMRQLLKRAIDLKVVVGKKEVPVTEFVVFSAGTQRAGIPLTQKEPGFCCVVFSFSLEPSLMRGATQVAISYRQAYSRAAGEAYLFYVPIFENLPKEVSTTDTNLYSITFNTTEDCSAVVVAGESRLAARTGQSVTLAPRHLQAIRVRMTTRSNKSLQATRDGAFSSAIAEDVISPACLSSGR